MRIKPYPAATARQSSTVIKFSSVVLHSDTRSGHFTTFRLFKLYYNVDYNIITE